MTDTIQTPRFFPARGVRRSLHALSGVALAVAALAFGGKAAAQSDSETARAAARAAAEAGDAAFKAGKYQEAADYFERAESMMHAPTLLLFAARSHMKLGHYVKAREAYIRVVREQMTPSSPPAFRAAQESAKAELPDVEKHLGRATIRVDGPPPKTALQVTLDGASAPAQIIGLPTPIDPGRHSVQVAAEGWDAGSADFTVEEQKTADVVVHLKKSPTAVVPPGGGETPPPGGGENPPGPDKGTSGGVNQGMRIGSYVAFGVGAVGVGLGTFFLIQKSSQNKEGDDAFAEKGCADPRKPSCDADAEKDIKGHYDDASTSGTISMASFIAGGAALVTGVTLFVLSGSSSSNSGKAHVTPYFAGTSAGVLGSF